VDDGQIGDRQARPIHQLHTSALRQLIVKAALAAGRRVFSLALHATAPSVEKMVIVSRGVGNRPQLVVTPLGCRSSPNSKQRPRLSPRALFT